MIQGPLLPPQPVLDPNFAFIQVLEWVGPIVMLTVIVFGLRWVFRSPVGEALAERIRTGRRWRHGVGGESAEHVAALEAQMAALRTEVSELAERVDFTERVLAERREPRLGAGQ